MKSTTLASLAALAPAALAQVLQGFNYGSTNSDNSVVTQDQFNTLFSDAKRLAGTNGAFTAARLFTSIQGGSQTSPTEAIPAAIQQGTKLLLGLWASGGQTGFTNEISALHSAVQQYGTQFTDLVVGISVGSEDLYRISPTGIENHSNVGAGPDVVTSYIGQLRKALPSLGGLNGKPVGHVDTWTAWVNGSNSAVIDAVDFIGTDAYPYFQNTMANGIDNGEDLFFSAYNQTVGVSGGKPVWITETGWPVSGAASGQAQATVQNAQTYWDDVACRVLGNINTFWYTLQDAYPNTPNPSFGLIGAAGGTTPLYDLSCAGHSSGSSSSSHVSSPTPAHSSVASVSSVAATGGAPHPASPASIYGTSAASGGASGGVSSAPAATSGGSGETITSTISEYTTVCPTTVNGKSTMVTSVVGGGSSGAATVPYSTQPAVNSPQPAGPGSAAPAPSASSPSTGGKSCPADLSGTYEFPHLIVPIDSSNADKAYGTQYNGTISSTMSSLFNFDIPTADQGKTCSLVFLLPEQSQLTTSSFDLQGPGGFDVKGLSSPATQQTTYNTCPKTTQDLGGPSSVTPGNSYIIASGPCAAGSTIGYEVSSTGSLSLNYFQDYNPSPIGLYITVC